MKSASDRFKSKYQVAVNGCWEWTASLTHNGYPRLNGTPAGNRAHRYSYLMHYGVDPGNEMVCHTCDNRKCVNPDHLFLDDAAGNTRDAMNKGRIRNGERHGMAKLTNEQVESIRQRAKSEQQVALAKEFGVSQTTISDIVHGKVYA